VKIVKLFLIIILLFIICLLVKGYHNFKGKIIKEKSVHQNISSFLTVIDKNRLKNKIED